MTRIRVLDDTPRFKRWTGRGDWVHKPEIKAPPSFLFVAILGGKAFTLDESVEPDLDGDLYPRTGSFGFESFEVPDEDGFYVVSFSPVSVRFDSVEYGTDWDTETRDSWRKLTDEELAKLTKTGFDDFLQEEKNLWRECLEAWPCQSCGKPCREHTSEEAVRWNFPDLDGVCP